MRHILGLFAILLLCFAFPVDISAKSASNGSKDKSKVKEQGKRDEEKKDAEREKRRLDQALSNLGSSNYGPLENAYYYFERMGKDAVPHLVKKLRDKGSGKRAQVNTLYILGRIGPEAKRAIPFIVPFLREEDADFKSTASIALGKIGKEAKDAVPTLTRLMFDDDQWVSENAVKALKLIGTPDAKKAVKEYKSVKKKKSSSKS